MHLKNAASKVTAILLRMQCVKRIIVFPNISAKLTFTSGWKSHWIQMAYQFLASRPMESPLHTKHDDVMKWKYFQLWKDSQTNEQVKFMLISS